MSGRAREVRRDERGIANEVREQQKRDIWVVALGVRILCAFTISTFFQPDEYFQSLEPAWELAFGKSSGAWITWEWHHQLRSSLHPVLVAALYYLVSGFNWVIGFPVTMRAYLLVVAPRILHGFVAAALDYFTWRLTEQHFGNGSGTSYVALLSSTLNPWHWFAGSRSLTNGVEATLTVAALVYWPWPPRNTSTAKKERLYGSSSTSISVVLAAFAFVLRPTNAIIWATLTMHTLFQATQAEFLLLAQKISIYGTAVLAISYGVDRLFYGIWVFPPARFLGFNVVENLAAFYGRNRADYYFTEGLPILLMTALPFALLGLYQAWVGKQPMKEAESSPKQDDGSASISSPTAQAASDDGRKALSLVVVVMVSTLSLISHKEVRFLYPLLPILNTLAAGTMERFLDFAPFPYPTGMWKTGLLVIMVLCNVIAASYISYVHQRGPLAVLAYVRSQFIAANTDALVLGTRMAGPASLASSAWYLVGQLMSWDRPEKEDLRRISVAFLMPCHSTPWRSHLVFPEIRAWALTCEPPIGLSGGERDNYLDEADEFYANPVSWLQNNMGPVPSKNTPWVDEGWDRRDGFAYHSVAVSSVHVFAEMGKRPWPRYVVFFEQLGGIIQEVLGGRESRYEECWRTSNSHWHDDWRRRGDMVVWCIDGDFDVRRLVHEYDEEQDRKRLEGVNEL